MVESITVCEADKKKKKNTMMRCRPQAGKSEEEEELEEVCSSFLANRVMVTVMRVNVK